MALYNQYRPRVFSEVLGQDSSIEVLRRQAQARAFHHAYLFFGDSGTGKTTTARILAATLNCEKPNKEGNCGGCATCKQIARGQSWNVLEFDAPRFRGIDDIKDLVYKAHFTPLGEGKKVYIIDECHQLTDPAWQGLLKLLEEPPPHLVVILCTTEYGKIPETVVSRCELFPFRKLKVDDIVSKLLKVAGTEHLPLDPKHARFIAETCGGNMRKAENLLQQCCVLQKEKEVVNA